MTGAALAPVIRFMAHGCGRAGALDRVKARR